MKKSTFIALALITISCIACDKNETITPSDANNLLIGYWADREIVDDNIISYSRSSKLIDEEYSIHFGYDDKFIEHKSHGWCATPPTVLIDFDGEWEQTDQILQINVGYWGGTVDYTWKIINLSKSKLVIELVSEEYHPFEQQAAD